MIDEEIRLLKEDWDWILLGEPTLLDDIRISMRRLLKRVTGGDRL